MKKLVAGYLALASVLLWGSALVLYGQLADHPLPPSVPLTYHAHHAQGAVLGAVQIAQVAPAPPTASLSVRLNPTGSWSNSLNVTLGQDIAYSWSSTNGGSYDATYTVSACNGFGNCPGQSYHWNSFDLNNQANGNSLDNWINSQAFLTSAGSPVTYSITYFVYPSAGQVGTPTTSTIKVTVSSATIAPSLSMTFSNTAGTVGTPMQIYPQVTGGSGSYSEQVSGTIPGMIAGWGAGGVVVVSGTPSQAGTYNLIFTATDISNSALTVSKMATITITGTTAQPSIKVSLNSSSPGGSKSSGTVGQELMRFDVSAVTDVSLSQISVDVGPNYSYLSNIALFENGTQLGPTIGQLSVNGTIGYGLPNVITPAGTTITFSLRADVANQNLTIQPKVYEVWTQTPTAANLLASPVYGNSLTFQTVAQTVQKITITNPNMGIFPPASAIPVTWNVGSLPSSGYYFVYLKNTASQIIGNTSYTGTYYPVVFRATSLGYPTFNLNVPSASTLPAGTYYIEIDVMDANNNLVAAGTSAAIAIAPNVAGAPPTASLTLNGQTASSGQFISVSAKANDSVAWNWSGSGADTYSSTVTVDNGTGADACGNTGTFTWASPRGSNSGGSQTDTINSCQAGHAYTVVYTAKNSSTGLSATATIKVNVASSTTSGLAITTTDTQGAVGQALTIPFYATGTTNSYSVQLVSGSVPGMAMAIAGGNVSVLQGTPTTAGSYPITVKATDLGTSQSVTKTITVTILGSSAGSSISVSLDSTSMPSQTVTAGTSQVNFASVRLTNLSSADVTVTGLILATNTSFPTSNFTRLAVGLGTVLTPLTNLAATSWNNGQYYYFAALPVNYVVPQNNMIVLNLYADLAATANGTLKLGLAGLTTASGTQWPQVFGNPMTAQGSIAGNVTIKLDPSTPAANTVVGANATGVDMGDFDFVNGWTTNVSISKIIVAMSSATVSRIKNLYLVSNGNVLASSSANLADTSGNLTFNLPNPFILGGAATTVLRVTADLNNATTGMNVCLINVPYTYTNLAGSGTTSGGACANPISVGTVPVPSLQVISPNGGEAWSQGSTQTISWQDNSATVCSGAGACLSPAYTIKLQPYYPPCTTNPCPSYSYLAPMTIASGVGGQSYSWAAGKVTDNTGAAIQAPIGQYLIQVCTANGTCDNSNAPFSITSAGGGTVHAAGTNVVGGNTVYFLSADGKKRPYTSAGAFLSYGFNFWSDVQQATDADLALPTGSFVPPMDGSLINDKGTVYIITNGQRQGFSSSDVFLGLGYDFHNAIPGDTSFMATGPVINTASQSHPAGTLVNNNGTVYLVACGNTMGFPTIGSFLSWGYNFRQVVPANSFDTQLAAGSIVSLRTPTQLSPLTSPTSQCVPYLVQAQ